MFKFYLNNYRSFLHEEFNFSKINILIGENSSGKSSILKFFLALKQSFENPMKSNLSLQGNYVDLGNYSDIIYYHKDEKPLQFGFSFGYVKQNTFFLKFIEEISITSNYVDNNLIKLILRKIKSDTKITFNLSKGLSSHFNITSEIVNKDLGKLIITLPKVKSTDSSLSQAMSVDMTYYRKNKKKPYKFSKLDFDKNAFLSLIYGEKIEKGLESDTNSIEVFYEIAYLLVTQNLIINTFENCRYVNPIDSKPERIYYKRDPQTSYIKNDIEKLVDILTNKEMSNDLIHYFLKQLNSILKDFGIAKGIEIVRNQKLSVSQLRVKIYDLWSNITDIGYGVSLQLPILFEAILAEAQPEGRIMLIEQPEVHLHPKLQSKLIEILLKYGRKNTYFIETHSEHILRKLQVMILKKQFGIKPDDVTINYFRIINKKTKISNHKILDSGKIDLKLPTGFYDNSYNLVKQLLV